MLALSSFGATKILYQQNFENVATPADAGWVDYRGLMTIASDDYGKFLEIDQNGANGGSTYVNWGENIFLKDGESVLEDGTYDVHFEFMIKNSKCNQYNSALTIFTNHDPIINQPYRSPWSPAGYWQNYLFDMSQVNGEALGYALDGGTIETVGEDGTNSYSID